MPQEQLGLLCDSLREELLQDVSRTGGHLASNLGVVELTVALHRVFDLPKDHLLWDVGHQAYVHKLLSGRAAGFEHLRQFGGLSGFPKRSESPYDSYDSGHCSTSISAAMGYAVGRKLKGTDERIVCVIGDGSMTGGVAFEGMNNVGDAKIPMTIILNDNHMAIASSKGALSKHLAVLRTSPDYLKLKKDLKDILNKNTTGAKVYKVMERTRDWMRYLLLPSPLFEELGLKYIGPIDGHDLDQLIETLESVRDLPVPCLVHVVTKKGKGYRFAEEHPDRYHGVSPFDPATGENRKAAGDEDFSSVFGHELTKLAEEDRSVVAVTAAMTVGTGLQPFEMAHPDRFFDCEIGEQHAVSFAAGLALQGFRPVVAVYSTFLQRAYDEILMEVCLQNLPVVFAVDRAGVVGHDGETHQGVFDLSYMLSMPNMTVFTPRDGSELKRMLRLALKWNGPVTVRYPRGSQASIPHVPDPMDTALSGDYRPFSPDDKAKAAFLSLIPPQVLTEGEDLLLLAEGKMVSVAFRASALLKEKGIFAKVVDVRCVKPLDQAYYGLLAAPYRHIFTLEDNTVVGGFGDAVSSVLSESGKTVRKFGWPDRFIPQGSQEELFRAYGLDAESVAEQISGILRKR